MDAPSERQTLASADELLLHISRFRPLLPAELQRHVYEYSTYIFFSKDDLKAAIEDNLELRVPMCQWDVSRVTDFSRLFSNKRVKGDISRWNVSRATTMRMMFRLCHNPEDLDLSSWDVSNAVN